MSNDQSEQGLTRAFLAGRDEPCPHCGYNVRDLQDMSCPECGKALRLKVGLEDPIHGGYLTGLIALSGATGFATLLLTLFLISAFSYGFSQSETGLLLMIGGLAVVNSLLTWMWVRNAARIRCMSRKWRARLIAAALLIPIATAAIVAIDFFA